MTSTPTSPNINYYSTDDEMQEFATDPPNVGYRDLDLILRKHGLQYSRSDVREAAARQSLQTNSVFNYFANNVDLFGTFWPEKFVHLREMRSALYAAISDFKSALSILKRICSEHQQEFETSPCRRPRDYSKRSADALLEYLELMEARRFARKEWKEHEEQLVKKMISE